MLNLRYQKATLEDLELLVTVRCRVLRAANLLSDDAPLPEVECQTWAYYRKAFAEDTSLREACVALGCQPMLVMSGKGEKTKADGGLPDGTLEFANLAAAVDHILAKAKK